MPTVHVCIWEQILQSINGINSCPVLPLWGFIPSMTLCICPLIHKSLFSSIFPRERAPTSKCPQIGLSATAVFGMRFDGTWRILGLTHLSSAFIPFVWVVLPLPPTMVLTIAFSSTTVIGNLSGRKTLTYYMTVSREGFLFLLVSTSNFQCPFLHRVPAQYFVALSYLGWFSPGRPQINLFIHHMISLSCGVKTKIIF